MGGMLVAEDCAGSVGHSGTGFLRKRLVCGADDGFGPLPCLRMAAAGALSCLQQSALPHQLRKVGAVIHGVFRKNNRETGELNIFIV